MTIGGEGRKGRRSGEGAMMIVDDDGDYVMKGTEDGAVNHTDSYGAIGSNSDNSFLLNSMGPGSILSNRRLGLTRSLMMVREL